MKLGDYIHAIIVDLKANAKFLKDVGTHGKVFGIDELKRFLLFAPAVRIALIGVRGGSAQSSVRGTRRDVMGRADTGQYRGPLQMVAFLIEQDKAGEEARDRVIRLVDQFVTYIEQKQWGLPAEQAGPASVTGFEIMYSAEVDAQGAAIAAVSFEQEVWFGRSLHDEDMALLTGDIAGSYPSGQLFWSEKEWADKGKLDINQPPLVLGMVTPMFVGPVALDTLVHDEIKVEY